MNPRSSKRRVYLGALTAAFLLTVSLTACGSGSSSSPTTSVPTTSEPIPMPPDLIISLAESERMVDGLPMADAQTAAESQGLTVREVRRDGEDLLVTQDYSPTRINVATSGGQVEAVVSIG